MKTGYIYIYSFGTILFIAVRKALLIIWLCQTLGGMEVLEFYCQKYFVKGN